MPALGGFAFVIIGFTVEAGVVDRFWIRKKKDALPSRGCCVVATS